MFAKFWDEAVSSGDSWTGNVCWAYLSAAENAFALGVDFDVGHEGDGVINGIIVDLLGPLLECFGFLRGEDVSKDEKAILCKGGVLLWGKCWGIHCEEIGAGRRG